MKIFDEQDMALRVAQQDWDGVWNSFIRAFRLSESKEIQKLFQGQDGTADKMRAQELCGLLAKNIVNFLSHPEVPLPDEPFRNLIFLHETIHDVLKIAGLDNTDAAVEKILVEKKISKDEQKKVLLLVSLYTGMDVKAVLDRCFVQYKNLAITSFLGYAPIYDPVLYENKMKLLPLAKAIAQVPPDVMVLENLVRPYFRCSYLDDPNKHEIKKHVNACIQAFKKKHRSLFPEITQGRAEKPGKPVLLIFAEHFKYGHAMFRSWAGRMKSFQEKFHVVFAAHNAPDIERVAREFCDEFILVDPKRLDLTFQKITAAQPDIFFFTSVGMTMTSILLSNHRWAPVQIMSPGHPATTYSRYMDYAIGPDACFSEDAFMTERWVGIDTLFRHTQHEKFDKSLLASKQKSLAKDSVNVFISGMTYKLSAPFFAFVKEMMDEADFKINLSIITGVRGPQALLMQEAMVRVFGDEVTVYGYHNYKTYMEKVKTADVTLNPFPFGHSHTMLDALVCGKPCVSMLGPEPHSRTEYGILKNLGLDEMFVAAAREDYKDKFHSICRNVLNGDTDFFDPQEVYRQVYETENDYDYGGLLKWIYDHHAEIQDGREKLVIPEIRKDAA